MYNRYVPKPDGSFQRNWVPDSPQRPPSPPPNSNPIKPQETKPKPVNNVPQHPASNPKSQIPGIGGFFRQLLPKDFCTEDLLVVLLLLLMSGDGKEDQNTALLTLALYLFL